MQTENTNFTSSDNPMMNQAPIIHHAEVTELVNKPENKFLKYYGHSVMIYGVVASILCILIVLGLVVPYLLMSPGALLFSLLFSFMMLIPAIVVLISAISLVRRGKTLSSNMLSLDESRHFVFIIVIILSIHAFFTFMVSALNFHNVFLSSTDYVAMALAFVPLIPFVIQITLIICSIVYCIKNPLSA